MDAGGPVVQDGLKGQQDKPDPPRSIGGVAASHGPNSTNLSAQLGGTAR